MSRTLTYFGHVMRNDDRSEKALRLVMSDGRRMRSRPRTRRIDGINASAGLSMQKQTDLTRERIEDENHGGRQRTSFSL